MSRQTFGWIFGQNILTRIIHKSFTVPPQPSKKSWEVFNYDPSHKYGVTLQACLWPRFLGGTQQKGFFLTHCIKTWIIYTLKDIAPYLMIDPTLLCSLTSLTLLGPFQPEPHIFQSLSGTKKCILLIFGLG